MPAPAPTPAAPERAPRARVVIQEEIDATLAVLGSIPLARKTARARMEERLAALETEKAARIEQLDALPCPQD